LLSRGAGIALDPFFNLKMVAGYTVFGFGAASAVFVWQALRLLKRAARAPSSLEALYRSAGLCAFLLPVLFFLPQLHSPRYFWRGCEAILFVAVSGCLPPVSRLVARSLSVVFCAWALIPLFIGIQMPVFGHPRLALHDAERFPSGDGHYPMGATLSFMTQLRVSSQFPVDHNQLVWRALQTAELDESGEDVLYVLYTPMSGHFMLQASLEGRKAFRGALSVLPADRPFYADSRSLMRLDPKGPSMTASELFNLPARRVSDELQGVVILQLGQGDSAWSDRAALLNRLMAGNEYRLVDSKPLLRSNRMVFSLSEHPFPGAALDERSGLYFRRGIDSFGDGSLFYAEAVLPGWMSMRAFSGK
jgi:hypothetical protein